MSSDWPTHTFATLIQRGALEIGDGYRAKNEELGGKGPIFLRAGHVSDSGIDFSGVDRFRYPNTDKFGAKVSRTGDVVITTKGNSTGRVTFVNAHMPAFVYSPHLSYWRANAGNVLMPGFLKAWSRSQEFSSQLSALSRSTDMAPYLSLQDQRSLKITVPPLAVQQAISAIAIGIDERIDHNRALAANLEAIARQLFKSWFVDFDPVRVKAAGEKAVGLADDIAELFPDRFVNSEMGMIPEGWSCRKVSDLCEAIFSGGTPHTQTPEYWGGELPWFSSGETRSRFVVGTEKTITAAGAENSSTRQAQAGDVVIASAGQGATRGQTSLLAIDTYINQSVVVLRAATESYSSTLLFLDLSSRYEEMRAISDSHSSRGSLTTKLLAGMKSIAPPYAVVTAFELLISPVIERIVVAERETSRLGTIRDLLLPRLISGKLRVADAESIIEEVIA